MVTEQLALLHRKTVTGLTPPAGLHVLPLTVLVLSGYSGFLQQFKDMHVRLAGDSKLVVGVNSFTMSYDVI